MPSATNYAPPPGAPPSYAPPPGSPPPDVLPPPASASTSIAEPASDVAPSEAPPPYTTKASDPLPSWSAHASRLKDLTSTENPVDLARLPLDPPPACFSTPTPARIRTRSFEPFRIPSREKSLQAGFRLLYAPEYLTSHGISADDWTRFLQDLGIAARLSAQGLNIRGSVSSVPTRVGGLFRGNTGTAYEAAFSKTPLEDVQDLITVWNESALERRKVKVSLRPRIDDGGGLREGYDLLVEAL